MIKWIKNLFTKPKPEPLVLTTRIEENKKVYAVDTGSMPLEETSQFVNEQKKNIDYQKMSKKQLLEEAKQRGVKVNASLKKSEIISKLM